jgi:CBS domain-containing protein
MVAEMTGSLALLPPAIVAIGLATLIVGDNTIYESQLRSRADSAIHRAAFGLPLLSSTNVADTMTPPRLVVATDTTGPATTQLLYREQLPGAPVIDRDGAFIGVVAFEPDRADDDVTAGSLADRSYPTVSPGQGLDDALDVMVSANTNWIPVVDRNRVVGIVGMNEVVSGYQSALRRSLRHLANINGNSTLIETAIGEHSAFAGKTVATAPWPQGAFALSIDRNSHLITPRADTALHTGDVIAALVPTVSANQLRQQLDGTSTFE